MQLRVVKDLKNNNNTIRNQNSTHINGGLMQEISEQNQKLYIVLVIILYNQKIRA